MATKRRGKERKPISEKQRAKDDALRRELQNFDLKKFDQLLEKAVNPRLKNDG